MSKQSVEIARLTLEALSPRERLALVREHLPTPAILTGPQNESLLLKQAEAGRLLGCSRHTIKRLEGDGLLHPVKLRGAARYRRNELLALAGEGEAS